MSPRAVHFGAGSIGRGFIGALLTQSGYHVTFADVNESLINAINQEKEYSIHILLPDGHESEQTSGRDISGCLSNSPDIVDELAKADIVTTAVGPDILKHVAPVIAVGIIERRKRKEKKSRGEEWAGEVALGEYLNIIACENRVGATTLLKELVEKNIQDEADRKYLHTYIGFANCSVDRIVPPPSSQGDISGGVSPKSHPSLDVDVESFYEWIVEKQALKGDPPFPSKIHGMKLTDRLEAYEERKLFTLNTGHAMTAYLGHLKGYRMIHHAIRDEEIGRNVHKAMEESGAALIQKHGFDPDAHAAYIGRIINRFRNPHLKDECVRVGREPLRKLGRKDRFVGPAQLCKEYGLPNKHLCRGIAAVLRYEDENDKQSRQLMERVEREGVEKVVLDLTGWSEEDKEVGYVLWNYKDLEKLKVTQHH